MLSILEELESRDLESPGSEILFTEQGKKNRLSYIIGQCDKARLDAAVNAVHSATDSFRPFELDEAALLEVKGTICSRALALNRKLAGEIDGSSIAPLNSPNPAMLTGDEKSVFSRPRNMRMYILVCSIFLSEVCCSDIYRELI